MSAELEKIGARYSAALDAKPGKGPVTRFDALVDSVADVPHLIDTVQRVQALTLNKQWLYDLVCSKTCSEGILGVDHEAIASAVVDRIAAALKP